MPTLRKDPISGRWVIIALERAKRPRDYKVEKKSLRANFCPFCVGNEEATPTEIARYSLESAQDWSVRVVPNKYPALRVEGDISRCGLGVYDSMFGAGAHEVIIECSEHIVDFSDLSVEHMTLVLKAWRERFRDLRKDRRLKCAVLFKNHGEAAGASLEHAHSQLIALPMISKSLQDELDGARAYYDFKERCVFCDIIEQERRAEDRLIAGDKNVIALAPYASRFPFETWLFPRKHQAWYEDAPDEVLESMAHTLRSVIRKLNRALDDPPFNLFLHSAPFVDDDMSHYHWHFELIPTLTKVAGFEWASGYFINPTPPEDAARHLRDIDDD